MTIIIEGVFAFSNYSKEINPLMNHICYDKYVVASIIRIASLQLMRIMNIQKITFAIM